PERAGRAAAEDDVHLLLVVALEVLFDHPLSCVAGVRIGAVGGDPEPPADGPEDEGAVRIRDRQLLELVDVHHLVPAHDSSRSSSSTTGSISSTPSTRSSRLTLPAQRLKASSRSPSYPSLASRARSSSASDSSTVSHSSRGVSPKRASWSR